MSEVNVDLKETEDSTKEVLTSNGRLFWMILIQSKSCQM